MNWKTTLLSILCFCGMVEAHAQCTPSATPTCVANVSTEQQLTDCLAAGASADISSDFTSTCDYDLSNKAINLQNQVDLRFTGNVTVAQTTSFTASTGNATIQVAGLTITANSGGGNGDLTFEQLNDILAALPGPISLEMALAALPVEFISFTGKAMKNKTVSLNWATATESNNKQFEVEYSTDGKVFKMIDKVKGAGSTFTRQDYVFEHRAATAGINYYRLKQVDYDGAFEYSNVISVELSTKLGSYRVFPNPVKATSFSITTDDGQVPTQVLLYNMVGQEIRLPIALSGVYQLPASLQRGTYIVRMELGGETHLERLVVQ